MKFREEILFADKGLGREIREYIEARLEIPKNCQAFSLIFAVDQPVQIKCEYFPVERSPRDSTVCIQTVGDEKPSYIKVDR